MAINDTVKKVASWIVGTRHAKPVTLLKTMIPIRGLAILLVVLAHSVIGMLAIGIELDPNSALSRDFLGIWQISSFWKSILLELCRCAVPIFLFLSGYYTLSTPLTWKAIGENCKKVLLPMIFWSLVAWVYSWRHGAGWNFTLFVSRFFSGQTQAGYYFIILIMQYYILSKWFVPAMKGRPGLVLAFSALIQGLVLVYDYAFLFSEIKDITPIAWILKAGTFPEYLFPRFMFSFALGVWASQSVQSFRKIIIDRFPTIAVTTCIMVVLLVLERGILFRRAHVDLKFNVFQSTTLSWGEWKASTTLWSIAAIFFIFAWFQKRIPVKSLLDKLGKNSMQIFLLHGIVLDISKAFLYKYFLMTKFYVFWGCILLLVFGITIPIYLVKAIKRWVPAPIRMFLIGT